MLASYDPSIVLQWGGEERIFRVGIGERADIELSISRQFAQILPELAHLGGLPAVMGRLLSNTYYRFDITEVIRVALAGGGEKLAEAKRLVERFGPGAHPDDESRPVALALVAHALYLPEELKQDAQPKKAEATTETNETADSASPNSTEPAP